MFVAVASSVGRCDAAAASDAVSVREAVTVETADKFCVLSTGSDSRSLDSRHFSQ